MKTTSKIFNEVCKQILSERENELGVIYAAEDSKFAEGCICLDEESLETQKKILEIAERKYLAMKKLVMFSELGITMGAKWNN